MGGEGSKTTAGVSKENTVVFNEGDFYWKYCLVEKIGSGTLSDVWTVENRTTKEHRAVKIMKKEFRRDSQIVTELVKSEVTTLARMDCPYITRILEVFQDKNKYYVVTELLKGVNLADYVLKVPRKNLTERRIARHMRQMLLGLQYCHVRNVIHRDIRPENIIFMDKRFKFLKLADFKFANITDKKGLKFQNLLTAPAYLAPEVLSKQTFITKSDIWSCGILGFFLLTGSLPYVVTSAMPLSDLLMVIQSREFTMKDFEGPEWKEISLEAKKFLLRMLQLNPDKRAEAKDLLTDPWIANVNTEPMSKDETSPYLVNMQNSIGDQKFHQAVVMYLVNQASLEDQKEKLVEVFEKLDKDKNQSICKEEFKNGLKEGGFELSGKEFEELFKKLDVDKNGLITYTEFVAGAVGRSMLSSDAMLEDAFNFLDRDKKGFLTKDKLKTLLGNEWISKVQLSELFKEIDTNKDNKISFPEFKAAMKVIAEKKSVKDAIENA